MQAPFFNTATHAMAFPGISQLLINTATHAMEIAVPGISQVLIKTVTHAMEIGARNFTKC